MNNYVFAKKDTRPAGSSESAPQPQPHGPQGGAYKDIDAAGGEVHHMPADAVSPYPKAKGPAIRTDKADHYKSASWGSSREAVAYRAKQKALIDQAKFKEAQNMDIKDIQSKFGNKYDQAIKEMRTYTDKLLRE